MGKTGWIVLIVLILVLGGAGFYWMNHDTAGTDLVTDENAVLLEDQAPGDETTVTYAKLAQPGYVTVYTTDANGNRTLLGASAYLSAGVHKNVKVRHTGGRSSNNSVISAGIVADDGDKTFGEETDGSVLIAEDIAMISTDATLDASLSDEELSTLLEEAGYDTGASEEGEAMEVSGDETGTDDGAMEEPTPEEDTTTDGDTTVEVEATGTTEVPY